MKFIARKGAPNIPLELIEAQESEKLVFFCGAGVSYSAGLPVFYGLVENVFKNLGIKKNDTEVEAIKSGFYDRALGLLEARIVGRGNPEINQVRKAIIEELTLKSNANLQNHNIILQLSKTANKKYRLVTTNVDHGFLKADPTIKDVIDYAPKLPVPKPHKWASVVHLHGIIDVDNDSNGGNLVFTSGDFGTAYLTERWASKFVTELFSHFTVLFVGYGVNDPVIRYITDAIAAERLRGYEVFKQPYIFARTKPTERSTNENLWKAKGIEPILYEYSHSNLYNSLEEWWNFIKDGLNAKARIVAKEAALAPLPPYDEAPGVAQLIDILIEKTRPNDENVTGYPAKVFSEIESPPAPIEWLPVLDEKGLLSFAQYQGHVFPVHWSPLSVNLLQPNKITFHLWHWLLQHLENDSLIKWIIDKGVCPHPDLKEIIKRHIKINPPKEPYLLFWRISTSNYVNCLRRLDSEGYDYIRALKRGFDQLTLGEFSKLLEPSFKIDKSIDYSGIFDDEEIEKHVPYELDVVIGISDWTFIELMKLDSYPSKFTSLLLTSTHSLKKTVELLEFADLGDKWDDRSHYGIKSISPHPQNSRHQNWAILIELCRDLWEVTWDEDPEIAIHMIKIWRSIGYPVFRRLVMYAMTVRDICDGPEAIDYLLENDGWWLWSNVTHREVFRMLNKFCPDLNRPNANILFETILLGPPRAMYRDDLTNKEFNHLVDREIWLKLSKIQQYGAILPENSRGKLNTISKKYPRWKLQEKDRDEFTTWMETGTGPRVDVTVDELFNKSIPEIIEFLSEDNQWYKDGRIDAFREGCKINRQKGVDVLCYLTLEKNWNNKIWHAGLVGLSGNKNIDWDFIAPLLGIAGLNLYREEAWSIAHWVKESAISIECGAPEEQLFWTIFNLLIKNYQSTRTLDQIDQAINFAINNPIGIITEALMDRFNSCKLKVNEGIPDGQLKDSCEKLLSSQNTNLLAGIIILASRLHYFHAIDPKWTEANLIPLFHWKTSEHCSLVWRGYLWSPRLSLDLAVVLKNDLLNGLKFLKGMGDSFERLIQLFTLVCLQYQDIYKAQEQRDAFIDIGVEGLEHIAEFLFRSLRQDSESADNFWQNRVKPLIKRAWPKSSEFVNKKISKYITLMIIELTDSFEEATQFIKPYLKPFGDLSIFFNNLNNKNHPEKEPIAVFELIENVFSEDAQWPSSDYRKVIDRIVHAEPKIKNEPAYRKINDYLVRHNK